MIEDLYQKYLNASGVSTDTRTLLGGEVFFALKGEHFDGNSYVGAALEKGCSYVVAEDPSFKHNPKVVLVESALETLQKLANHHRRQWNGRVLAITGSNGKTTTKELVSAVLSRKYKTLATQGNLNNHIGVPLTLLGITDEEIAVVEMGANHPGEISLLCEIAGPDIGIITNIGKAHLEGFGGMEGVEKAKGELYDYLAARNGVALVNISEHRLQEMAGRRTMKIFSYGMNSECDLMGTVHHTSTKISGSFYVGNTLYSIESQLFGLYNFMNILTAAASGVYLNVDGNDIKGAIEDFRPDNNRSQVVKGKSNTLVLDAYNANPTSMRSAIGEFTRQDAEKKMLILGDMHELGAYSVPEHENILQMLTGIDVQQIILVGDHFLHFSEDPRFPFTYFSTIDECMGYLGEMCPSEYHILLKGSRRNTLEKATKLLLNC